MFEIDLHGMRLHDAIDKAREFIESNYYNGAKSIKIIHGRGDGILKMEIRKIIEELKSKPLRLIWQESDNPMEVGGVTIVICLD